MAPKPGDTTTTGEIVEIHVNIIKVKLPEYQSKVINVTISGKMLKSHIRVAVGDKVKVVIPQGSPNLGRIIFREKS